MKKSILGFLLLIVCACSVFAQTEEAVKIDEFGITTCDEYRVRLDVLMLNLEKSPDAKGYVFVYEGDIEQTIYDKNYQTAGVKYVTSARGSAKILIDYFKNHLGFRKYPAERFVFINGGFREKFTIEFWVVPKDSSPPEQSPTLKKIKQKKLGRDAAKFCSEP